MTRRPAALALVLLVALPACGDDKEVGKGLDLDQRSGAGQDFGTTTTGVPLTLATTTTATTAPKATTTAPPTTAKATTTTRPPATTAPPTTVKQVVVTIDATGFTPQTLRVFVGQQFSYTNKDSQPRGVKDQGNRFQSGPIAPGGSWTFAIPQAGTFQISDSTRPFVVGTIQVVAR